MMKLILTMLISAVVFLAGCAQYGGTTQTKTQPEVGAAQIVSGEQADIVVDLTNFKFTPSSIIVNAGDVVEFRNVGGSHTVTFRELGIDESMSGDKIIQVKFNKAGTYNLICKPHESLGMIGSVDVS